MRTDPGNEWTRNSRNAPKEVRPPQGRAELVILSGHLHTGIPAYRGEEVTHGLREL